MKSRGILAIVTIAVVNSGFIVAATLPLNGDGKRTRQIELGK
jgi:hypothetical protein